MATQEIPREQWPAFLDEFSRLNEGYMASLETLDEEAGDLTTDPLPFQGISLETKGSAVGTIMIMLGTEGDDHTERAVPNPTALMLKPAGEAGPAVLEIKTSDNMTLLLSLEPAPALT